MGKNNAKPSVGKHFRHTLLRPQRSDRTTPLRMRGNVDVGEGVCDRRDEAAPHLQKHPHARRPHDDQRPPLPRPRPLLPAQAGLRVPRGLEAREQRQQERETQVVVGVRVADDDPPKLRQRRHSLSLHSQQLADGSLAAVEENPLGRHREQETAH